MRRILPFILVLAIAGSCGNSFFSRLTLPERVQRSIVNIAFQVDAETSYVCTGFVVSASHGLALTARHCVPPDDRPFLVDEVVSQVVRVTDSLALVTIPKMQKPPLDIADHNPLPGEEVVSFGGKESPFILTRHVASISEDERDVALDGPLIEGMSGGPVVNKEGKVVGINQGVWRGVIGVTCGPLEIRAFLK